MKDENNISRKRIVYRDNQVSWSHHHESNNPLRGMGKSWNIF